MAENVNITIRAFDKTKKGFGSATKGLKAVAGSVFSLRTALIGVAGAAGFGLLVRSSLNATDSLAKTAAKIGTTTDILPAIEATDTPFSCDVFAITKKIVTNKKPNKKVP